MSDKSAIEWTDATWNPVTGCSKVSPGCANCYAETLSLRFGHSKLPWTPANAVENVVLHPERLRLPLTWRAPRRVFVNSMSDMFHELVPATYAADVFAIMSLAARHSFQVLTKRPERMALVVGNERFPRSVENRRFGFHMYAPLLRDVGWPLPNVWLGTSIENDRWVDRADALRETPAAVRFLSLEPLLGPLPSLDLTGIGWVIVGGESGPGARPMHSDWVRDIRDRCVAAGIPFFFKQWGAWGRGSYLRNGGKIMARDGRLADPETTGERFGAEHPANLNLEWIRRVGKGAAGRELDGRTWDEMPRTAVAA
jgi:protein gp37